MNTALSDSVLVDRRAFLRLAGAGAAAFALGGCPVPRGLRTTRTKPPLPANIILIYVDDLGWKDVGYMGNGYYETPHIDALAHEGVVFTNAYANAPNCAPSRACLLSGQYPPRHGVYTVGRSTRGAARLRKLIPIPNKETLDPGVVTIAEALRPAGYACASIGKWHLGDDPEAGPLAQGFDVNVGGNHVGHPRSYFCPYQNPDLSDGPRGEYLTDRLTDEALRFIHENSRRPFFLYLSHYAVHTPLQAPKNLVAKYDAKHLPEVYDPRYAAMIESVDQGVGRVMETLRELGLDERTIVIFYSDNGARSICTSLAPLRGSKGMLYEGGIRVPLVVRWPGHIEPETCDEPVIGTDLYPTILAAAHAPVPAGTVLDGENLLPLLTRHQPLPDRALYWHFPAYLEAGGDVDGIWRTTPAGAIRYGDWKLIEFFEDNRLELYNLRDDIGEKKNLATAEPEKTRQLLEMMRAWRSRVHAPVPTERNPAYRPTPPRRRKRRKRHPRRRHGLRRPAMRGPTRPKPRKDH